MVALTLLSSLLPDNALSRYKVPSASTLVWGLSIFPVNASWHPNSEDDPDLPVTLSAELEPWLKYRRTGERLSVNVSSSVTMVGSPTHVTFDHPWERSPGWQVQGTPEAAAGVEFYPRVVPIGVSANASVRVVYNVEQYNSEWYEPGANARQLHAWSNAELGVFLGRVRDATAVVTALRVEDILREEGLLQDGLSDGDLQDLAGLIARRWVPVFEHDAGRDEGPWYDELERRTRSLGPRGAIPARVWLRIRDALVLNWYSSSAGLTGIPARLVGIRLQPVARFEHRTAWERWQYPETTEVSSSRSDSLRVGLKLDAAWPLTHSTHLLAVGAYWPNSAHAQSMELSVSHLVGEQVHADAKVRSSTAWGDSRKPWGFGAGAGLDLFLTDRLALSAGTELVLSTAREDGRGRTLETKCSVSASVTGRLN